MDNDEPIRLKILSSFPGSLPFDCFTRELICADELKAVPVIEATCPIFSPRLLSFQPPTILPAIPVVDETIPAIVDIFSNNLSFSLPFNVFIFIAMSALEETIEETAEVPCKILCPKLAL